VSVLRGDQQRSAWRPGFWVGFLTCAGALVLAVPALNFWVPPNSPAALPDYLVPLLGKYLCYALLAVSLDLVWGYAGILSLGHGAFFALGGYCMGMYLMRQIGTRGVYGNPLLPDFMVFLQLEGAALVLVGIRSFRLCGGNGRSCPRRACAGVRLASLPISRHRGLSVDHHAGDDIRADARLLPQRHGVRRQ